MKIDSATAAVADGFRTDESSDAAVEADADRKLTEKEQPTVKKQKMKWKKEEEEEPRKAEKHDSLMLAGVHPVGTLAQEAARAADRVAAAE